MTVYVDTNVLVYAVEPGPFTEAARRLLNDPRHRFVTSVVTKLELLGVARSRLASAIVRQREAYFDAGLIEVLSIDDELVEQARILAAMNGLKALDALHVASAIRERVDLFATNDHKLTRVSGLPARLPADW